MSTLGEDRLERHAKAHRIKWALGALFLLNFIALPMWLGGVNAMAHLVVSAPFLAAISIKRTVGRAPWILLALAIII